jgi:hypothetical protein
LKGRAKERSYTDTQACGKVVWGVLKWGGKEEKEEIKKQKTVKKSTTHTHTHTKKALFIHPSIDDACLPYIQLCLESRQGTPNRPGVGF